MVDRFKTSAKPELDAAGDFVRYEDYEQMEIAARAQATFIDTLQKENSDLHDRNSALRTAVSNLEHAQGEHEAQLTRLREEQFGALGAVGKRVHDLEFALEAERTNRENHELLAQERLELLKRIRDNIDALLPKPEKTALETLVAEFVSKVGPTDRRG